METKYPLCEEASEIVAQRYPNMRRAQNAQTRLQKLHPEYVFSATPQNSPAGEVYRLEAVGESGLPPRDSDSDPDENNPGLSGTATVVTGAAAGKKK